MRKGLLASAGTLLVSAGLAAAQQPAPMTMTNQPPAQQPGTVFPASAYQPMMQQPATVSSASTAMPAVQQPGAVMILSASQPAAQQPAAAPAGGSNPAPKNPAAAPTGTCTTGCPTCAPVLTEAPCACPPHAWVSAEYLLWWTKKAPESTPVVTVDPIGPNGQPINIPVLGGAAIDSEERSGARFTAGTWLNNCQTVGIEGSYFFLAPRSNTQSVSSDGNLNSHPLTVMFINPKTGAPDIYTLADPGAVAGGAVLTTTSELQSADLNGLLNLSKGNAGRLDLLGGFRYLNLHEGLTFATDFLNLPAATSPGGFASTLDQFTTRNNFYGGQLGLQGELDWGRLFVCATGKVALGDMNEFVNINGSTYSNLTNYVVSPPRTTPGGIFAQPTNIGGYSRDEFAVVPELDFNVGYNVTRCVRVFVGYTFLYVSDVVRPGNQIDPRVNFSQSSVFTKGTLSGPALPGFGFQSSDYWAQGINFGVAFRF